MNLRTILFRALCVRVRRSIVLRPGGLLRLRGARAVCVAAREAPLWITTAGNSDDVFVGPRTAFRLRSAAVHLVSADRTTIVDVEGTVALLRAPSIVLVGADGARRSLLPLAPERAGRLLATLFSKPLAMEVPQ